jgi:hypothetical protein
VSWSVCWNTCILSLNGAFLNNPQTESITTPSNIIDHLPFIINETDVYYIAKDLTVNGDGITILANNTVLIGQGHSITGDGTGNGINITSNGVAVIHCIVRNFTHGISLEPSSSSNNIRYDRICNNFMGVYFRNKWPNEQTLNCLFSNIIINNDYGLAMPWVRESRIWNNYFRNNIKNSYDDSNEPNNYNETKNAGETIICGPYIGGNYWHDYMGQDTDGDGLGNTPYIVHQYSDNRDYLPLVDITIPHFSLRSFNSASSEVVLNVSCIDNAQVDKVVLEFDGVNYTDLSKIDDSLGFTDYEGIWSVPVEHKVTYAKNFINLSIGQHHYRWFANDTRNQWNSTELQSFNVVATPVINSVNVFPVLKISANITCEGTSNISELMNYVALHYKIDDNWFAMNMTYDQQTFLYSALTTEYNQLAGKTIQYYVVAEDKNNNTIVSETFTYQVPDSVGSDLNRDGIVDIFDIVAVALRFGEIIP